MKNPIYILLLFLTCSCQEIISFEIDEREDVVVIDGFISDKSYQDVISASGDGRYFEVTVRKGKPIGAFAPIGIDYASVQLEIGSGSVLTLDHTEDGVYKLCDESFRAVPGESYRIAVYFDEKSYISAWQSLPEGEHSIPEPTISYETRTQYSFNQGKRTILDVDMLLYHITLPDNTDNSEDYYTWDLHAGWVYEAWLANPNSAYRTCYATSAYYLDELTLASVAGKGMKTELFDMPIDNAFLDHQFTVLITQKKVNGDFFYFLNGLKEQTERGTIFDSPPYNLPTNISGDGTERTAGFFAVVSETHYRWFANHSSLGFAGMWDYSIGCINDAPGPRPADCYDCRQYRGSGNVTNARPAWWR